MREKARIKRILKLIEKLWEKHQDFRFGQLLINYYIVPDDLKTWHNQDNEFEKYLQELLKKEDKEK